ncbi:MAG: hypothetical protein R2703_15880 [Micropruina glycogenica]
MPVIAATPAPTSMIAMPLASSPSRSRSAASDAAQVPITRPL